MAQNAIRPVILYERIACAARNAAGPPIVPAETMSQPTNFQAPEKMVVDYVAFNYDGEVRNYPGGAGVYSQNPAGITNPREVYVRVEDQRRNGWSSFHAPIESYNNIVRTRDEVNQFVDVSQLITVPVSNGPIAFSTVPAGKWLIVVDHASMILSVWNPNLNAFSGVNPPAGVVHSDGANVRIVNTSGPGGAQHNAFLYRTDQWGTGEWWMSKPFEIAPRHQMIINVRNNMTAATKLQVTFNAVGKMSNKTFILTQDCIVAAGATVPFSGTSMYGSSDEPLIIYSMGYTKHPDEFVSAGVRYDYDPRQIMLRITPSQGAAWSTDYIPLIMHSNLRGDYVSAMHRPNKETILDVNDFLVFRFNNYAPVIRYIDCAVVGHTV